MILNFAYLILIIEEKLYFKFDSLIPHVLRHPFSLSAAQQQPPLQCWHCSSDTIGAEDFCGDEFKEDNIPTESLKERNLSVLRNCNSSIASEHERAVCRKTVEDSE